MAGKNGKKKPKDCYIICDFREKKKRMNSMWLLLFFLPLISAKDNERTAKHICLGEGKMKFLLNISSEDSISDIFSTDQLNSCSLSGKDFIGNGTEDFPYEITVDVSRTKTSLFRTCGAKIIDKSFEVEFAVKSGEYFFQKKDRLYTMECRIQNPQFTVFGEKALDDKFYHSYPITMKLVYENSTDISGGKVTLGEKVKLQVQIKPKASAENARVTLCYVGDTLNISNIFFNNKCFTKSYQNNMKFLTNKTNPKVIESTTFETFKFPNSARIKFSCYVEFCDKEKDQYCKAKGCVRKGTFMHSYTEAITQVLIVTSGASNPISFTLMPMTAIVIFLTKLDWF